MGTRLEPTLGVNSQVFEQEWESFLRRRKELFDEIQTRLTLRDSLKSSMPELSDDGRLGIADAIGAGQRLRELQNPSQYAMRRGEANDLDGRARFYGINTEGKAPDQIWQEIEARRVSMRQDSFEDDEGFLEDVGSDFAAALGIGGAKSIARVLQTLPLAGDFIANTRAMKNFDSWLSMLDEGFRADMWEGEVTGYDIGKAGAGVLAYAIPATMAWKFAGTLIGAAGMTEVATGLTMGGRLSPIARTALKGKDLAAAVRGGIQQGTMAAWMLESGGDAPWQERMAAVALGGAFGGAGVAAEHTVVPRIANMASRVKKNFRVKMWEKVASWRVNKFGVWEEPPTAPQSAASQAAGEPIMDAEWEYVNEPTRLPRGGPGEPEPPPFMSGEPVGGGPPTPPRQLPPVGPYSPPTDVAVDPSIRAMPSLPAGAEDLSQRMTNVQSRIDAVMQGTEPPFAQTGFPEGTVFHGTARIFDQFDPTYHGTGAGQVMGRGFYLTENPAEAGDYSLGYRRGREEEAVPHVRAARLNLDKPLIASDPVDPELAAALRAKYPSLPWQKMDDELGPLVSNSDLIDYVTERLYYGPMVEGQQVKKRVDIADEVNEVVRSLGFDAYRHRMSGSDNWIVWDESKISDDVWAPLRAAQQRQAAVVADAVSATKQAAIMESPATADLASQVNLDDADVAQALMWRSPGQVNIVRNVGDLAKTIGSLVRKQQGGKLMPHQWRIISREVDLEGRPMPVPAGRVRLYRGAPAGDPTQGEWFSTRRETAEGFARVAEAKGRGKGVVYSVDVPEEMLGTSGVEERFGYQLQPGEKYYGISNKRLAAFEKTQAPGVVHDILISDGINLSQKKVEMYAKTGLIDGMRVATADGIEGIVVKVGPIANRYGTKEMVTIRSPFSKQEYHLDPADIMPGTGTSGSALEVTPDAPAMYGYLGNHVMEEMTREMARAGLREPAWLGHEVTSQLPRLMEEFLDNAGIENPVTRAAYTNYFNERRVLDYKNSAPVEDQILLEEAQAAAASDMTDALVQGKLSTTADEAVQSKDFVIVTNEEGGLLVQSSDGSIGGPVDTPEQAVDFVRNIDRPALDLGEPGNGPDELIEAVPGASHPGSSTPPNQTWEGEVDTADEAVSWVEDEADEIEAAFGVAEEPPFTRAEQLPPTAGGGGAPPPPTLPPFVTSGGYELPPIGPRGLLGKGSRVQWGLAHAQQIEEYMDSAMVRVFMPTRNAMREIDNFMNDLGLGRTNLAQQYEAVSTQNTKMKAATRELMHEADGILTSFSDRKFIRDGTIVRLMRLPRGANKAAAMQQVGYTSKDVQAQHEMERFLGRFLADLAGDPAYSGIGDASSFAEYVLGMQGRQLENLKDVFADFKHSLPSHLRFLEAEFREANVDFRELNANRLMHRLIRSAMFQKYVRADWDVMNYNWNHTKVPPALKAYVGGYLKTIRYGRNPAEDGIITGTRRMLNVMGIPVTNGDLASVYGGLVGSMYRAWLGLSPAPVFREFFQPMMAWVKHGNMPIPGAYMSFMTDPSTKKEMVKYALSIGATEPGRPTSLLSDVFEDAPFYNEIDQAMSPLDRSRVEPNMLAHMDKLARRRDTYARLTDLVWNSMPQTARRGIQDTVLDPLLMYGKTTSAGKIIVAWGSRNLALQQVAAYRNGQITLPQLHEQLSTAHYGRTLIDEMNDLLRSGADSAVVDRYAREIVAEATQRTGISEQPQAIREAKTFGQVSAMLGHFSIGTMNYFRTMKNAPTNLFVSSATRYSALLAGLAAAEATTGFKFSRWAWHRALMFTGSPIVQAGAGLIKAAAGAATTAQGYAPTAGEAEAIRNLSPTAMAGNIFQSVFPYAGGIRTAEGYMAAMETPNPNYYGLGFTLTGERPGSAQTSGAKDFFNSWTPSGGTGGFQQQDEPPFMQQDTQWLGGPSTAAPGMKSSGTNVQDTGVSDPSKIYRKGPGEGYPVYDSANLDANGRTRPTHRLDVPSGRYPNETWEQYEARVHAMPVEQFPPWVQNVENSVSELDQDVGSTLTKMIGDAKAQGIPISINETYRPVERQEFLFKQGRSIPGSSIVTWTLTSDHATRRAADLVPQTADPEKGWQWIQKNAPSYGFSVLGSSDPGHVSMPRKADTAYNGMGGQRAVAGAGATY